MVNQKKNAARGQAVKAAAKPAAEKIRKKALADIPKFKPSEGPPRRAPERSAGADRERNLVRDPTTGEIVADYESDGEESLIWSDEPGDNNVASITAPAAGQVSGLLRSAGSAVAP